MRREQRILVVIAGAALVCMAGVARAEQTPPPARPPAQTGSQTPPATPLPAPGATPAQPQTLDHNWTTRCGSKTRVGSLECTVEQSLVKSDTRQLVLLVRVGVPGDTRTPVLQLQLPLGIYLPAGVILRVDDKKVAELAVQTCDAAGCYISGPLAADLLAAMQTGKTLHISFQSVSRETLDLTMPLAGFSTAFDGIK